MDQRLLPKASISTRHRLKVWAHKVGLWNKLAIGLVFAVTLAALATYLLLGQSDPANPKPKTLYVLLVVNLALALPLGALIARLLVQLFSARRSGLAGARLHGRMVALFSLIAITPTIIMAVFTLFFFEEGLQSWFSDKVRTMVRNATSVAEAYIEEHQKVIKADILGMANDLNASASVLSENRQLLEQSLTLQARMLSLSEAIIFDGLGRPIVRANAEFTLGGDPFPKDALTRAADGRPLILASEDDDRVRALVKLDRFFDAYLYISRYVDPRALALVYQTRTATTEYEQLAINLSNYRLLFNLTYIGVAFIILLTAILAGLWVANRLATPIAALVMAAERVRQGDFSARVPVQNAYDELGILTRSFNRMTSQIKAQRDALVETNHQLEDRRRFTEAVLYGVSSGVVGLSPTGDITLPNRSACTLLELSEDSLIGRRLTSILPEITDLIDEAEANPSVLVADHVTIKRGELVRNFLVRVTAEREEGLEAIEGYVVTFDDITEQVAAQRMAAWADVARRIAHEIKNPLTPIQLSAERLQRKYGKEISTDPQIFKQCTDTIIRQVGDLRSIVDEFSAFARMPTAVFAPANILELVQHTVFLQEVSHPEIKFSRVVPNVPVELICDGRLLTQALTNLLKNAVEAIKGGERTPDQGEGAIEVTVTSNAEETIITVADDGPGFPETLRDRLTEPYVTTRTKGTGLGLAIVKKIIEEHGASLHLNNRDGKGADVTVVFNHATLARRAAAVASDGAAVDAEQSGIEFNPGRSYGA